MYSICQGHSTIMRNNFTNFISTSNFIFYIVFMSISSRNLQSHTNLNFRLLFQKIQRHPPKFNIDVSKVFIPYRKHKLITSFHELSD